MATYSYKAEGDRYIIYEDDHVLTTPAGNKVGTLYKHLADRIILDLERYGMNVRSASSILAWHFTMIDNFAPMGHERVEQIMGNSFLTHVDWTCRERYGAGWGKIFGDWGDRREYLEQWLSKATLMQMTAACCIGNAYESLNLALVLALILEKYEGEARDEKLGEVAQLIADTYQFGSYDDIFNDFKTFELYYGIHLDEDGKILDEIVPESNDEDDEEELNMDDLTKYSVTVNQLIGRNFYHYTDCEVDEDQPAEFPLGDLELDESEDEEDEDEDKASDEDDEDDEDEEEGLADYLPDDCWVKRFVDDDDPNTCYLLYLVVGKVGSIEDSGCIEETTQRMGGGGSFFMIPGMDLGGSKSYGYASYPPEKVTDDLKLLFKGRSIPLDFSFIGKQLPQNMIDESGNGGSNTDYIYARQSAYRLAYMHMSVDTTEEGIIEGFSYSSYQSSGSGYGDMFSRPVRYSDRRDEAADMLLHIYDMYSDEEFKSE